MELKLQAEMTPEPRRSFSSALSGYNDLKHVCGLINGADVSLPLFYPR